MELAPPLPEALPGTAQLWRFTVSEGSKPRAEKLAANIANEFGTKTTVVHGSVRDYAATREMVSQALKGLDVDHIDILGKLWRENNGTLGLTPSSFRSPWASKLMSPCSSQQCGGWQFPTSFGGNAGASRKLIWC